MTLLNSWDAAILRLGWLNSILKKCYERVVEIAN